MLRRTIETMVVLIFIAVVALLGAARVWHEPDRGVYWRIAELAKMPQDSGGIDFVQLQRRATGNDALICPERLCQKAKPELISPVFPVAADDLRKKVTTVVMSEPDSVELACADTCNRVGRFVEYSTLFQFPDTIDVRVVEAGANASTLAIYSRSVVGIGDQGVNLARAKRWLASLQRIMPRQ